MPKITDFEPAALAELLASIGKADAKVCCVKDDWGEDHDGHDDGGHDHGGDADSDDCVEVTAGTTALLTLLAEREGVRRTLRTRRPPHAHPLDPPPAACSPACSPAGPATRARTAPAHSLTRAGAAYVLGTG